MELLEKVSFAYKLLEEVKAEVLTTLGSPPFPELGRINAVAEELFDYLEEHDGVRLVMREIPAEVA